MLVIRFSNNSLEALYSSNNGEALAEGEPERKLELLKGARMDGKALTTDGNSQVAPYFRGRFVIFKMKDKSGQTVTKKGFLSDFTAWNGPKGKMYYTFFEKVN